MFLLPAVTVAQADGGATPVASAADPSADLEPEPKTDFDPEPMKGVGIGLKLGYLSYGTPSLIDTGGDQLAATTVAARGGLLLSLPFYFGSTFGFTFEPFLGAGDLDSLGLYLGPHFNLQFDKLYVGAGFGIRAGYVSNDYLVGVDLHGRIPIRATYYVHPQLGLLAELGIGYGASGFKVDLPGTEFRFGTNTQIDFSVGVRWR